MIVKYTAGASRKNFAARGNRPQIKPINTRASNGRLYAKAIVRNAGLPYSWLRGIGDQVRANFAPARAKTRAG